jgi:two-component system, chemotaxis family, sensor kinase CheA
MGQVPRHIGLLQPNNEGLNEILRCAHSVNGGAATFGFVGVAELTHQIRPVWSAETGLPDRAR